MARGDLADALKYSWTSVMDDLAKTTFDSDGVLIFLFAGCFYGTFYVSILGGVKSKNDAYRYFKENPEKLSRTPMTLYSECPNCGASNATQSEICPYCGSLLKISDGTARFVKTED